MTRGEEPLKGEKLAVIGAGPIGLRAALELALLGAQVHVFDTRAAFNRSILSIRAGRQASTAQFPDVHRLSAWDRSPMDLRSERVMSGCTDGWILGWTEIPAFVAKDHIGIRELQALLMKLCLLAKAGLQVIDLTVY
eukprot:Skav235023  [mRNA]  locus=scaffold276:388196:390440:+ [translate_table: standard]